MTEAAELAKQTAFPTSKVHRTGGIRTNRGREKEELRDAQAFRLPETGVEPGHVSKSEPTDAKDDLLYLDLIRKNAEERNRD